MNNKHPDKSPAHFSSSTLVKKNIIFEMAPYFQDTKRRGTGKERKLGNYYILKNGHPTFLRSKTFVYVLCLWWPVQKISIHQVWTMFHHDFGSDNKWNNLHGKLLQKPSAAESVFLPLYYNTHAHTRAHRHSHFLTAETAATQTQTQTSKIIL